MNRRTIQAAWKTFSHHTSIIQASDNHGYIVKCKKGLWGVVAPTYEEAIKEGQRYFWQYYVDGKYNK